MKHLLWSLILASVLFACGKKKDPEPEENRFYPLKIKISTTAGAEVLQKDELYTNASGENFRISRMEYFISHLKLTNASGLVIEFPDTYHLLNAFGRDSLFLQNVPHGSYSSITFMIGVDSTKSKSGAHSGDLDPTNNMFMEWSGYTYLALEGQYQKESTFDNFSYIIRGFNPSKYYSVQNVKISFPSPIRINGEKRLQLNADVQQIFSGPKNISIAANPEINQAGKASLEFSENYRDMFTFLGFR